MNSSRNFSILCVTLLVSIGLTLRVPPAWGQTPGGGPALPNLQPGKKVSITTVEGNDVTGTVADASKTTLEIDTIQGRTALPAAEIRTIRVHKSGLRNLIIGTTAGVAGGWIIDSTLLRQSGSSNAPVTGPLLGGSIGAGMMMLVARGGPHVVYEAPVPTTADPVEQAAYRVVGKSVIVTIADGSQSTGLAKSADANDLAVSTAGTVQQIPLNSIRRIEVKKSGRRGVVLGLIVGGAGGVALGTLSAASSDATQGAGTIVGLGAGLAALGGGLGYGLTHGLRTEYASTTSKVTLSVAPLFTPTRVGLNAMFRWQ